MSRNINNNLAPFAIVLVLGLTACASSSKQETAQPNATESSIVGNIPAAHPLAKVKISMSQNHVHEILGQPTDSKNYQTGKAFIPFYFGSDMMRLEELYKGIGRITFTGVGIGGVNFKVFRIIYDPAETGFADK